MADIAISAAPQDAAGKNFAARLDKLEQDIAVLTEVLADLVPLIKDLVNRVDKRPDSTWIPPLRNR